MARTPRGRDGLDGPVSGECLVRGRLAHHCSSFERCGHVRGWSGLYAVTPDCSGIAGRIPWFGNLFEVHSFTGRGVVQSYAIGRGLAELIVEGSYRELDLSPLVSERFTADPKSWVTEDLHI